MWLVVINLFKKIHKRLLLELKNKSFNKSKLPALRNVFMIILYQAINNLLIEFPTILTPPEGLIPLLNQMLLVF